MELNNIKDFLKKYFIILLIFVASFGVRVLILAQHPGLHIDEPSSFMVSTPNNRLEEDSQFKMSWNWSILPSEKNYSSQEIQNAYFKSDGSIKSVIKDIYTLRKDNLDRQHPPLYHSILRIWNYNLGDFSYEKYLYHARNLNLIFFIISFYFLYKLLNLIKKDTKFVSLGLFFGFLNSGSIMLDTMARDYSLIQTGLLIATYITVKLWHKVINNEDIKSNQLTLYALGYSIFCLSGYFAVIYTLLCTILIIILAVKNKRFPLLKKILFLFFLTIFFTQIIYPDYFNFSYRNEHYNTISKKLFSFSEISATLSLLWKHIEHYIYYNKMLIITLLLFFLFFIPSAKNFYSKNKYTPQELAIIITLIVITLIWAFIIDKIQPFSYARYILPGAAIFTLLYTLITYNFKYFLLTITATFFLLTLGIQIHSDTLIDKDRIKYVFHNKQYYIDNDWIEYKNNVPAEYVIKSEIPVVIVNPLTYFIEEYMFANILNNNIVRIEKNVPPEKYIFEKYILIVKDDLFEDAPDALIRGNFVLFFVKNGKFDKAICDIKTHTNK